MATELKLPGEKPMTDREGMIEAIERQSKIKGEEPMTNREGMIEAIERQSKIKGEEPILELKHSSPSD